MPLSDHLKKDVAAYYAWAEREFPEPPEGFGLSFLLFDLECKLKHIDDYINSKTQEHAQDRSSQSHR